MKMSKRFEAPLILILCVLIEAGTSRSFKNFRIMQLVCDSTNKKLFIK